MRFWKPRARGLRRWFAGLMGLQTAPLAVVRAPCAEPPTAAEATSTEAAARITSFLQPVSADVGVIRIATLPRTPGLAHLVGLLTGSTPQDHRA